MKINIFTISLLLFVCLAFSAKSPANDPYSYQNSSQDYDYANSDDSVAIEYPAIDNLEKKILGGVYVQEDVYKRLNRLETKMFGQISSDPLIDRVDKLEEAAGMQTQPDERSSNRSRNVYFGQGFDNSYDYENSYNGDYDGNYNSYYSDDNFENQAEYEKYRAISSGANVLNIILMILQGFL